MKKSSLRNQLKVVAVATLLSSFPAINILAGSASYDFETDPSTDLTLIGDAAWIDSGGNPGGYLQITSSTGSQRSTIIFNDFDNGLVVQGFTFSCDLMIGDGTDSPADGFSINFAREGDPALVNADGSGFAGIGSESNLPEEGTTTGLGIGFDAWQSTDLATAHGLVDGDVHYDCIGISVRVDNQLVFQKPMRTLNGAGTDATSLQTGPIDTTNPGSGDQLTWQPLKVVLSADGLLNIWWKGTQILSNQVTSYFPSRGRLILSGRTGGSYQIQAIDNINITTLAAATPTVSSASIDAFGLTVKITDASSITLDASSLVITMDGQAIVPTSVSKTDDVTTIRYNTPSLVPSASTHAVDIAFKDSTGQSIDVARDIVAETYTALPVSYLVPTANVDKTKPGFRIHPYQVASGQPNSIPWTEEQLEGFHGDNLADLESVSADSEGYVSFDSVIDFKNSSGSSKYFSVDNSLSLVGIPGPTLTSEDNSTLEIITYIEFPSAGIYTFGIDSDDGYKLTTAANPKDRFGVIFGSDGAVSDVTFDIAVTKAGIYPFRLITENGSGGDYIEWYSVVNQTNKILINDTATEGALKAYRTASSAPLYTSYIKPVNEATDVFPYLPIVIKITDGDSSVLDPASIIVKANDTALSTSTSKSGKVTTITATPSGNFDGNTEYTATLIYAAQSSTNKITNTWTFTTVAVTNYPTALVSPVGSGNSDEPGFNVKVYQINEVGSYGIIGGTTFFEQVLNGYAGDNIASTENSTNGVYVCPGTLNLTTDDSTTTGNFSDDVFFPGMPGSSVSYPLSNFALEIMAYIEFPTNGMYIIGVDSCDGFKLSADTNGPVGAGAVIVNSPSSIAGGYYAVSAGRNLVSGISLDVTNPITGKLVYAQPNDASSDLTNPDEIKGNIALIDRGTVTFSSKCAKALAAGAIGVVMVNSRDESSSDGIYPIVQGGDEVDIASYMITLPDGAILKEALNSGDVNVTLSVPDTDEGLLSYDGTRSADESIVALNVTQAGVYPLHIVYFKANDTSTTGSFEFYTIDGDGNRILVNDTTNAKSLKTYRSRTYTPVVVTPTLSYTYSGGKLVLTYTGVLQSSTTVNGTFTDVSGSSPLTITSPTGTMFYRVRN